MSSTLKFCLRIRYSSRSSGPSKVSRNTSSASGGMYRSVGSLKSGSPYKRAKAMPSTVSGVESVAGAASAASVGTGAVPCASSACVIVKDGCLEVLVVRVGRLLHARRFLVGAFLQIDRLFVPQQRAAAALFGF